VTLRRAIDKRTFRTNLISYSSRSSSRCACTVWH